MEKKTNVKHLLLVCCAVGVLSAANASWAIDNCAQVTATIEADADSTPNDKTDSGGNADVTRVNILAANPYGAADDSNSVTDDESCAKVVVDIGHDFGDAPDTYLTTGGMTGTGAVQEIVSWLRLGALTDAEADGKPTTDALGDAADSADEDGVNIPALTAGQKAPVFTATATNTAATDAFLACWVDYNGDGLFNAGEFGNASVPAGSTDKSITVNMPNVPTNAYTANDNGDATSSSYARCRLSNVALSASNAGGVLNDATGVADGEVEDYVVSFNAQPTLDIALLKRLATGQAANVKVGDTVSFTIEVRNQGDVIATGIAVTDYIPTGLKLVAGKGWTDAGNGTATLDTPIATLAAGGSTTRDITFTVEANAALGNLVNAAEISAVTGEDSSGNPLNDKDSVADNDSSNETDVEDHVIDSSDTDTDGKKDEDDHDIATITVDPLVDVSLTKTVKGTDGKPVTNARRGGTLIYVLTVTNKGPHDATGVVINDALPVGVIYVSNNSGTAGTGISYNKDTGAWDVGNLPNGASRTLEITVTIP